jgi:hypothetical protein
LKWIFSRLLATKDLNPGQLKEGDSSPEKREKVPPMTRGRADLIQLRLTLRSRVKNCATALAMLVVLTASLALAEDFKTVNGKEYKDAIVSRVESDGIVLRMKSGIVKVYFRELPKEVYERFDHVGSKANASNIPSQTPVKEVKPPKLSAAITKLQRQGLLQVDCIEPDAKAWIAAGRWKTWDAQEKENVAKNLAAYCHPQRPSIWILDKQSGRKLASYGPFQRFEVY